MIMLLLDFYHTACGSTTIQFNPECDEAIPLLRESLKHYQIQNPALTFTNRYKYVPQKSDDDLILKEAEISDLISRQFFRESADAEQERVQNVLVILSRLLHVYLTEHQELQKLKEQPFSK